MSVTYPDYSFTNFPDSIDIFDRFTDLTITTYPLAQAYYALYNAGDIQGASNYLDAHPELKKCYVGASTLNPLIDSVKAIETFYMSDVQQWIINAVKDKGDFSTTTKYQKFNVVGYYINGATEAYMCINNDTPIGTLPTNTTYWRPITLRGAKGDSGIGLAAQGAWSALVTYPANSMVAFNNALWGSLIQNVNIAPSISAASTWYKIIEFSADLLTFVDSSTGISYQFKIENGSVALKGDNTKLDIALKTDIPTTLPANGGTADTISTTLSISKGGTGATTAAGAISNLGITSTATELNYVKGVTSSVQTQLNAKAASSHTHTRSQITDFPSSLPASGGSADYATNANYSNSSGYAGSAGNSDTVDGYHITVSTSIPTSLSDNVFCFVYE